MATVSYKEHDRITSADSGDCEGDVVEVKMRIPVQGFLTRGQLLSLLDTECDWKVTEEALERVLIYLKVGKCLCDHVDNYGILSPYFSYRQEGFIQSFQEFIDQCVKQRDGFLRGPHNYRFKLTESQKIT